MTRLVGGFAATMTVTSPTLIRDPWRRAWRFATGDALLAAVLIVLALCLALLALLPQTPQNDPVAYSRWLSETQQRFGNLTTPLITLGLFSIANSILFRLALGAVAFCCALRLLDQIDQLRAIKAVPDVPAHPIVDQTLNIDLATTEARLHGYSFRSRDDAMVAPATTMVAPATMIMAERFARRSIVAALMVYGGAVIILLGLVLGSFVDTRADGLVVEPSSPTAITGTPYAIRLDALTNDRASITLLNQTELAAQGEVAAKQPFAGSGFAIYLGSIGPALIVTATNDISGSLRLQSAADDPLQPEKFAAFTPDRSETFIAAPAIGVVLQIAMVNPDHYNVQAYQSATGKILTSSTNAPGSTLVVSHTVFAFQPSAFITVSAVNQPSHWLIIPAWMVVLLGIIGLIMWQPQRVWLQAVETQTRVITDDVTFDLSTLDPTLTKMKRVQLRWLIGPVWFASTAWLIANIIAIYPRAASLTQPGSPVHALLGAWLIFSGSAITRRMRLRLTLIGVGIGITVFSLL
jgi:cytochrome c biogenesis protein ResB